ncbi:MAG TPA: HD domain-containing protein [Kofleriaceae bacterium]|jgi:(p)ppGpp synthase/HD superfamily hydrolase|nr:HD domain-containing protein [Kofleriaceae bacterium]
MWSPDLYLDAIRFAAERHAGQLVPGSGLPYVVHVASVAVEVMGALTREPFARADLAVACAVLHDTVEDTPTTAGEIAARFGDDVAAGVSALSKNPALPKHARMADSLDRIRAQPREVWLVKLADRIVNLAPPPPAWSADKRRAYQAEATQIHSALAEASPYLAARLDARIAAYSAFIAA